MQGLVWRQVPVRKLAQHTQEIVMAQRTATGMEISRWKHEGRVQETETV